MTYRILGAFAALLAFLTLPATADESLQTSEPAGKVILTVTGAIEDGTAADGMSAAEFDLAMLKSLPATEFETTTIWTEGVQRFRGVALADLLEHLDAATGTIRATALNDYGVEIPTKDAVDGGPIIAYMRNGDEMSVREKGPLWIIYPYDSRALYRSERYYSRSIWQLRRLTIVADR